MYVLHILLIKFASPTSRLHEAHAWLLWTADLFAVQTRDRVDGDDHSRAVDPVPAAQGASLKTVGVGLRARD